MLYHPTKRQNRSRAITIASILAKIMLQDVATQLNFTSLMLMSGLNFRISLPPWIKVLSLHEYAIGSTD